MPVVDRAALEDSPLADLHALASELGIDGFRRLRKAELIDAILTQQGGEGAAAEQAPEDKPKRARRSRRKKDADEGGPAPEVEVDAEAEDEPQEKPPRARRSRRREESNGETPREERIAEGVVELLGNGSGFLRVNPPEASDDDVYISAAQVRRCELVSGDKVSGPVRPPRRSERYPSLVRIDTINDRAADEVAEGTHFEDLPAAFPTQRFSFGETEDPTLKAVEWLTPIGRGSRATIVGPARAGKTEALRRIAAALAGQEGLEICLVLAGVRPEEVAEWKETGVEPTACLTFAAGVDALSQAVERAVETAKRLAARGGDAVVLLDTLDGLHPHAARRALAAARDIAGGGSLTIVATSSLAVGGETTVIALDAALTAAGRFPAIDLAASGTLKPEKLVGDAGADAIAQARAAALAS
jgi:transcription termination factor Rho